MEKNQKGVLLSTEISIQNFLLVFQTWCIMQYVSSLRNSSILKGKAFRILDNGQPQNWNGTRFKKVYLHEGFFKEMERHLQDDYYNLLKSKYCFLCHKWPRNERLIITPLKEFDVKHILFKSEIMIVKTLYNCSVTVVKEKCSVALCVDLSNFVQIDNITWSQI